MTRTMKKFTGFVLMVCMIVSLFAGVTTAFAAKNFTDVPESNWAKPYVDFVVDKGFFAGVSEDRFDPDGDMTRGMFVAVIAKVEGLTLDNNITVDFADVPSGKYYTGAVKWAADNGIVSGYGNGNFGPYDPITREQICVMMDKYIQYHDTNNQTKYLDRKASVDFKDASDISSWAKDSVEKCVSYGLIQGFPDGKFYPKKHASRAEVAVMIYRLELVKEIIDSTEYTVSYKLVSGTEGKELPEAIPVPQDNNKYRNGDVVIAMTATPSYRADGGTWTFEGWKENPITVQDANVEFVGTYTWKADTIGYYSAKYEAYDDKGEKTIPDEVIAQLPSDSNQYQTGDKVTAQSVKAEKVEVANGTWSFVGFGDKRSSSETQTVNNADVVFKTYWSFTPKSTKFHVTYVAKIYGSDEDAPAALQKRCPTDENEYSNGDWLITKDPTNTIDYSDEKGNMWIYRSNSQRLVRINNDDVVVYQYWSRRPSDAKKVTYAYTKYVGNNNANLDISILDELNIRETLPVDNKGYYYGDEVTVMAPSQPSVPRRDLTGEWVFVGWDGYDPGDTFTMGWIGPTINGTWKSYQYSSVVYANDPSGIKELNNMLYKDSNKYVPTDTVTVQEPKEKEVTVKGVTYKYTGATIVRDGKKTEVKGSFTLKESDIKNGKTTITWNWEVPKTMVTYKFANASSLPTSITDILKEERFKTHEVGNETYIIPEQIDSSDWVVVEGNNKWVWQGWNPEYYTNTGKPVTFTGTWTRTNTLVASFDYVLADEKSRQHGFDDGIMDTLEKPKLGYKNDDVITMPDVDDSQFEDWEFLGWKKKASDKDYITSDKITKDTTYIGYWKYTGK